MCQPCLPQNEPDACHDIYPGKESKFLLVDVTPLIGINAQDSIFMIAMLCRFVLAHVFNLRYQSVLFFDVSDPLRGAV
jgi:hypothetical protein